MTAEFHPSSSGSGDPVGLAQEILDRIAADTAHADLTTGAHNLDALLALKQDAAGAVVSVNGQAGVVTLAAADVAAQPTDSDLTAIAALTTTTFGRALLTLADAAAGRAALGLGTAATQATSAFDAAGMAVAAGAAAIAASQPVDSDLTAIAALTTTTFGRSLLALADAAALKSSLSLVKADVGLANVDNTADVDKPLAGDSTGTLGAVVNARIRGKNIPTPGAAEDQMTWKYDHASGAMVWTALAAGGGVSASDQGFVNHGSTAGTARPATYGSVTWIGSVAPTNAQNDDIWLNTAPYRLEVLADAPFGYWPDSAAGPLADAAGAHNITLAGGATVNVAGPLPLADTKAVQYDGVNDGGSVALDLSDTPTITVEFWLWWDAFANDDDMALEFTASASSTTGGFFVDPNAASGTFMVLHQAAAGNNTKTWARPTAATWHHYAFVLDMASRDPNQEILGYLDGAMWAGLQSTATDSTNNFANSTLNVMCRNGASLFGAGKMAHLAIYKKRLAATRVNDHFNATRSPRAFLRVAGAWTETSA